MSDLLPPGVSQADFTSAIGELREVLPADAVIADNEADLRSYRDPFTTLESALPSAAVTPRNVEEIQKVLVVARKYRIPLWTISTGRNLAYGGASPRKPGYIVLDLNRMNRVLEVNEKYGYAVVEPGVTYFDMYNYLQRNNIKLWIDPASPGWGGVLGNTLDHGAGYTPYGDHLLMQCGMQVILADGTVIDTAMGALPNSTTGTLDKYGCGPWVDGLFTQSNVGVVTKIGMWLMPEPPGYRPFLVTFQNDDDLAAVTDAALPLKLNMVIPNAATTVGLIWEAGHTVTRAQYFTGKGAIPDSARRKIANDLDIGMWNFYGALYGPEPLMDNNWEIVEASFGAIPGAKFYFDGDRPNDPGFDYRSKLMRGIPNMTEFSILNWTGSGAHIDFAPMSPVDGKDALRQFHIMRDRLAEFDLDYCGEFLIGWRDMHHIIFLLFDGSNPDAKRRAHEAFALMIEDAAADGYGEYRTHLNFMDQIAETYDWNDRALWRLHERIKDALDPDGILSPGKQGIWPKHLRGS